MPRVQGPPLPAVRCAEEKPNLRARPRPLDALVACKNRSHCLLPPPPPSQASKGFARAAALWAGFLLVPPHTFHERFPACSARPVASQYQFRSAAGRIIVSFAPLPSACKHAVLAKSMPRKTSPTNTQGRDQDNTTPSSRPTKISCKGDFGTGGGK